MLMPMQKKPRLVFINVISECDKTEMHLIITIMCQPRRVVRYEDIHLRERG